MLISITVVVIVLAGVVAGALAVLRLDAAPVVLVEREPAAAKLQAIGSIEARTGALNDFARVDDGHRPVPPSSVSMGGGVLGSSSARAFSSPASVSWKMATSPSASPSMSTP